MSNTFRRLRQRILTPSLSETKLDVRGFHRKNPAAVELLETVGESFLTGYAAAAEARHPADAEPTLEAVRPQFRGFAYEGAAMGFAVLDALPGGRSDRVATFLAGRGADHIYMAYVGVGWAMARVPRFRWSKLLRPGPAAALAGARRLRLPPGVLPHPPLRARPVPGAGLRVAGRRARPGRPAAPSTKGIGRAMWFVGGTDTAVVADLIDRFPAGRRADLYGGAGLAATYAGGAATPTSCGRSWDRAGEYRATGRPGQLRRRRCPGPGPPGRAAHRGGHPAVLRDVRR